MTVIREVISMTNLGLFRKYNNNEKPEKNSGVINYWPILNILKKNHY